MTDAGVSSGSAFEATFGFIKTRAKLEAGPFIDKSKNGANRVAAFASGGTDTLC